MLHLKEKVWMPPELDDILRDFLCLVMSEI